MDKNQTKQWLLRYREGKKDVRRLEEELEELREMKGQPVWTVTTGLDGSGRWELVCDVDYEDVLEMASCVDGFYAIEMDTYGSTWTAYRRPLERMKKIMRENGIMVIPSEYPGSTEKWNIQKPRDKKEEL